MKRRGRRYAEGGEVGYEENPEPGVQSDREPPRKKPVKKGTESRKVSAMEFIRKYEDSPTSSRIREEAASAAKKSKQNLPGDRSTGFAEQRGIAKGAADLDQEDVDRALKSMKTVGEAAGAASLAGGARAAMKANIPLRIKQMLRRKETSRINEMERGADKAEEAAHRGMSRRDMPSESEKFRAQKKAAEARAARREGREERALPNWKGDIDYYDRPGPGQAYSGNEVFRKGGRVKSSASNRADGIAKKGKTRGRMI